MTESLALGVLESPHAGRQRLSHALALSLLVHAVAMTLFSGLVRPLFSQTSGPSQSSVPLRVALVGAPTLAFTPLPEAPPSAPDPILARPSPTEQTPATQFATHPPPTPPEPVSSAPAWPPLGESVAADVGADSGGTDIPPPGETAVGSVNKIDRLGTTQALRLAQRFPKAPSQTPQLRSPLVVAYPPSAARAHVEARIAALLFIDDEGRIVETTLFPADSQFGSNIIASLKNAKFTPGAIDNKPAYYWTILEFVFTMHGSTTPR
jgi:hypothetical protein